MKTCLKCNLNIVGEEKYCPLCQNELAGESSESYFNYPESLRKASLFYNIQFLSLTGAMIICLLLDFGFKLCGAFHWSIIVVAFVAMFQILVRRFRLANAGFITYLTYITYGVIIVGLIAGYLTNTNDFCLDYIFPGILSALLFTQFGLLLADRNNNVLAYILGSIVINVILVIFICFTRVLALVWIINISTLAIVIIGIVIFKKMALFTEMQKRLHV